MLNQYRCAVVTMAPFPKGNVSTLRYTSYLLALVKRQIYSLVLIYCPTTMAKHISYRSGIYKGIEYQYATKITWGKFDNLIVKICYLLVGLFNCVKYIRKKKINILILYGENPLIVNLFFLIVCKLFNVKYIGDRSEYPSLKVRNSKVRSWIYKKKIGLFDGIIVMTHELFEYYSSCSRKVHFCFLLPMTIDVNRFDNLGDRYRLGYIATVFGVHNRDGLYETIKAFLKYKEQNGSYNLWLIGNYDAMPNKEILDDLIYSSKLSDKIQILGKVDIDKVPKILYNASCLITTPNFYISGGFPTKLGEYMLSGTPVIATKVGEIPNYVNDKREVLLVEPGNIDDIADKILFVEKNPKVTMCMALNAEKKAKTVFSASTYVDGLLSFFMN